MPSSSDRPKPRKNAKGERDRDHRSGRKGSSEIKPPPLTFAIVHEDEHVLVVEKPAGLASATPKGADDPSVFRQVKRWARKERGLETAWIIHRLDRDVSGLMVFALSETAFHWLKEDFRARRVERHYLAVVEGELKRSKDGSLPSGSLQSFLKEDMRGRVTSVKADRTGHSVQRQEEDKAKFSVTHWQALHIGHGRSLVRCSMESGRKHQIRVHLQEMGHPIVGDPLYGGLEKDEPRLLLHAEVLGIRHPADGQSVTFRSAASERFYRAVGMTPPKPDTNAAPALPHRKKDPRPKGKADRLETSWDAVSGWYTELLDGEGSDHLNRVIVPGAMRLLEPKAGERILDLACGEGQFCRELHALGVRPTGVDAAPSLIAAAKSRSPKELPFEVVDARDLAKLDQPAFDGATCIMALMNIDPLAGVFTGIAQKLKAGGRFVAVLLHPAFRAPRQSSWGTDHTERPARRFRRIDGYLSNGQFEIVMNPGEVAHGRHKVTTWTFHRPLQTYVHLLHKAGFAIEALEEWPSQRSAPAGQTQKEELRVRREIPMFLAFRARKIALQ